MYEIVIFILLYLSIYLFIFEKPPQFEMRALIYRKISIYRLTMFYLTASKLPDQQNVNVT